MQNKVESIAKGFGSLQNLLIGIFLIFMGGLLLTTNEIDTINHKRVMAQGADDVISVNANEPINPKNNGKLIHASGVARTMDSVTDDMFHVSTRGMRLWRIVQMYQWQEKDDPGSSSNRKHYVKDWSNELISSTDTAHENPIMPIIGNIFDAQNVTLGEFTLSYDLISQIQNWQSLLASDVNIPEQYKGKMKVAGDTLYLGDNPDRPVIGDLKISFQYVDSTLISIVAKQNGNNLEPFGIGEDTIAIVEIGNRTANDLFQSDSRMSIFSSWNFRIGGFIFMFFAAFLLQSSFVDLLNRISGTNALSNLGSKKIAIILGFLMSFIAMALGWLIAYVPFVKYIILILFLIGFLKISYKIFKKLTNSKSIFAKIILVIVTLIILLIILVILAFIYLTRPY